MSGAASLFAASHGPQWQRMEDLTKKRHLNGLECAELVDLYSRGSADLAWLQTEAPDPAITDWLSQRLARARSIIAAPQTSMRADLASFVMERFPLVLYRARWWWISVGIGFGLVALVLGIWVALDPQIQQALMTQDEIRQLVETDFQGYYSANPAASFAAQVWTNNVWAAAAALVFGMLFVLPAVWVLWVNAMNVGVIGGIMAANGRLDLFFGLITPHGLLELTGVFAAAAVGMRVGWALIAPGARPRSQAAAQEGRAAITVALGLVGVLAISGVIEAFVTPSGLPTWARITIGVIAWVVFIWYVLRFGRRAQRNQVVPDQAQITAESYPSFSG